MLSMIGMVVCLSLVVITGFVGQMSLAQVTLAGVSGFVVSHFFVHAGIGFPWGPLAGFGRRGGGRLRAACRRCACAARASRWSRSPVWSPSSSSDSSTRRGAAGPTGSPVPSRKLFGFDIGPQRRVPGARRQAAEPCARFRLPGGGDRAVPARRQPAPRRARSTDAGRARQRAGRGRRRHQRRQGRRSRPTPSSSFIAGNGGLDVRATTSARSAPPASAILIALGFVAFAYIGGITMVSGAVIGGLVATEGLVPHFFQETSASPATGRCWSAA